MQLSVLDGHGRGHRLAHHRVLVSRSPLSLHLWTAWIFCKTPREEQDSVRLTNDSEGQNNQSLAAVGYSVPNGEGNSASISSVQPEGRLAKHNIPGSMQPDRIASALLNTGIYRTTESLNPKSPNIETSI